jgi:pyruvate kinase
MIETYTTAKNPEKLPMVNAQITDAVSQSVLSVLGEAPAQAVGVLYQIAAQASGMAMQNAVSNQNNLNQLNSTLVTQSVNLILLPVLEPFTKD